LHTPKFDIVGKSPVTTPRPQILFRRDREEESEFSCILYTHKWSRVTPDPCVQVLEHYYVVFC